MIFSCPSHARPKAPSNESAIGQLVSPDIDWKPVRKRNEPQSRERRPLRPHVGRAVSYLVGCLCFSVGAYLFINSNLGTDPLDVFALGLLNHVPLTIGIAQGGVAVLCLLAVAMWTRNRPVLSPMFTFFFCGSVIDLLRLLDARTIIPLEPYPLVVCGTVLCAYGSSLIIMSGFGIRAMDLLAIVFVRKWRWPFWTAKGMLEVVLLVSGWLMGGPVGVGTVSFLVGVDLLIQPLMWVNQRLLRIRNIGLARPDPAPEPAAS
jgi:uncharacterized membrane protein YczE